MLELLGITPPKPRTLTRATLDGLPLLVTYFQGPASYTGQTMVELQLPGNPALLDRILHRIIGLSSMVRLAEPGEFTARAFLAGKMDLPQAEGIAAAIAAVSDSELAAARLLREGKLGTFAAELVDALADALALVESGIDFTDQEDVVPIAPPELVERVTNLHARLTDLLAHSRSWGALEALPRVVLVGAPSAGKSTLFNALLGRQRTVVSAQPGTTRDVIAEPLTLPGNLEIMLVDIAGLDAAANALDQDVQQHARTAIESADLVLHISDGIAAVTFEGANVVHVHSKADLGEGEGDIQVSALTGQNMDALRDMIVERVGDRAVSVSAQMLALQPRHEQAIRSAADHLAQAIELAESHGLTHVELIAGACRAALDELAGLGGQMTPDDVIGRVFARFCIGK